MSDARLAPLRDALREAVALIEGGDSEAALARLRQATADDWPPGRPRTVTCGLEACGALIQVRRDGQVPGYCAKPKTCRAKAMKLRYHERQRQERAARPMPAGTAQSAREGCGRPRGRYSTFCHPPVWCSGRRRAPFEQVAPAERPAERKAVVPPIAAPVAPGRTPAPSLLVPPADGKLVMPTLPELAKGRG
jgi:hypothetical protein